MSWKSKSLGWSGVRTWARKRSRSRRNAGKSLGHMLLPQRRLFLSEMPGTGYRVWVTDGRWVLPVIVIPGAVAAALKAACGAD